MEKIDLTLMYGDGPHAIVLAEAVKKRMAEHKENFQTAERAVVESPWGLKIYEAARAARLVKDMRFVDCGPAVYVTSGGVICKEKI